jgi:hypothetical protein
MASSPGIYRIRLVAVVESVVAMALALGVAIYTDSLFGIAVGACLAPLLLLRSPASVATGIRWFQAGLPGPMKKDNGYILGLRYLWLLVWSFVVRIAATLRHPISGIQSVPENWKRVVLCSSVFSELELIPEMEPVRKTLRRVTFDETESEWGFLLVLILMGGALVVLAGFLVSIVHFGWAKTVSGIVGGVGLTMITIGLIGIACYFVACSYRICLKSTALLWLPLLYVVKVTFDEALTLEARLREIRISAIWKLIRVLAWITIFLFGLKLAVLPQVIGWWNDQRWAKVLNVYVMPNIIHPWHIAAFANALIALIGYYVILERAPRLLHDGVWSARTVEKTLRVFTFIRTFLSIYTIVVLIYLTVIAAITMHWPEVSVKPFPWQK